MLTYALHSSSRGPMLTATYGAQPSNTPYVSIRQQPSAYVSIRQHTSAYVSIRQHCSPPHTGCPPRTPRRCRLHAGFFRFLLFCGFYAPCEGSRRQYVYFCTSKTSVSICTFVLVKQASVCVLLYAPCEESRRRL
jgi:hypothetical protein